MTMLEPKIIFISHTHIDKPIADKLSTLIETIFNQYNDPRYTVSYSSRKTGEGSIGYGGEWYKWIQEQVKSTELAFVILTPSSVQKPWVLWEAGALAGALLTVEKPAKKVIPLSFGLGSEDIPSPFSGTQVANGADVDDITRIIDENLLTPIIHSLDAKRGMQIGKIKENAISEYIKGIEEFLLSSPHLVTEATVMEWVERLDNLKKNNRSSEAGVYENWLDLAFGREKEDEKRPIDMRIHRRLGEMYAASGKHMDALHQFEMARKLAPRDMFILRSLAKAHLDNADYRRVKELIEQICKFDKSAFVKNPENAAFKAKYHRLTNDYKSAEETLSIAITASENAKSYYLRDLLGQLYISVGKRNDAISIYESVIRIIEDLNEENIWVRATSLTAAMVTDNKDYFVFNLKMLIELRPSRGEFMSIDKGVRDVAGHVNWDLNEYDGIVRESGYK
jgi:tetratricopeptide (TPR) repeat protein